MSHLVVVQHIDALRARALLGKDEWLVPQRFGPAGWRLSRAAGDGSALITCCEDDDGIDWRHASIAYTDRMPTYDDLKRLHRAAFPDKGWAYQVFAPASSHVNIHENALHLWGHCDGSPALQDFSRGMGTI